MNPEEMPSPAERRQLLDGVEGEVGVAWRLAWREKRLDADIDCLDEQIAEAAR